MFFAPPQYVTFFAPLQYITFFAPLQYEVLFYIVAHVGGSVTNCGGTKTVTPPPQYVTFTLGGTKYGHVKILVGSQANLVPQGPPFPKISNLPL